MWPWLAIAGLGALHGLSPVNGWMFAAGCGLQARDSGQALRVLLPIAIGHLASIAIVVAAVYGGMLVDRTRVQVLAGGLLIAAATYRCLRGAGMQSIGARTSHAGIALWSCLMATAHGAGLMLVPALVPLCISDSPARAITASGSIALALAAVAVHMATMLLTTGAIANGVCRGIAMFPALLTGTAPRNAWTAALAVAGAALLLWR
ncbi:hypothetical protein HIV01_012265 [Lysobacter arenosi]|uniref:Uncharacterized protein n=1 Tax=Lysobacter arenosi TaxID=2795387 RepID=A0ABX7RAH4_9GAMM|nr:hypothetical protein [Lysobacter arenosi]QSX73991.1 hypothetical protein HIV01_012265 [Lysobacter arenosi]